MALVWNRYILLQPSLQIVGHGPMHMIMEREYLAYSERGLREPDLYTDRLTNKDHLRTRVLHNGCTARRKQVCRHRIDLLQQPRSSRSLAFA